MSRGLGDVYKRQVNDNAGLDAALAEARAQGKPLLLDFYADWCVSCKEMESDTFP
uniref:thioredoxin family protein n=1 Tax=Aquitalea sp. ASV15 TaxID=2795104 RepID=UPI0027155081